MFRLTLHYIVIIYDTVSHARKLTMALQRYLVGIEIQMKGSAPSFAVEFRGTVHPAALSRAFELLYTHHPVLRGRIRRDDKGYLLYVPPNHHPELAILHGNERTLQREAQSPWDITRAVAKLTLIRSETEGFIALRADHAIVDARSLGALFGELWRLYTDIVNGSDTSVDRGVSLPSSPTDLIRQRWGRIKAEPSTTRTGTPRRVCEALRRRIVLTEYDTTRLLAAARAQRTSVHALVCGAILVALRAHETQTEPAPMACRSVVDLRNRVRPPVGSTETTNFLGFHIAEVSVSENADPIIIGREVKKQLDNVIARRELLDMLDIRSSQLSTSLQQHLANVSITNAGVIPRLAQPADLAITDFLVLPPHKKKSAMFPTYAAYTYDKQLSILCGYPSDFFTDEEVEEIVSRTTAQLCLIGNFQSA